MTEETRDENEVIVDAGGFEDILAQFIEKLDKPSIKNGLKDSLVINKIANNTVYFTTISKVGQLIFNNKEHARYVEDKLSEVMGRQVNIDITFENKESYFARKLEDM